MVSDSKCLTTRCSPSVTKLSLDGCQPNEDAVWMQSQRLVPSILPDTVQQ